MPAGIRGNMNNFLTRADCEATCPVWVNPCATGQPILGINNMPEPCDPRDDNNNGCPAGYWCHAGGDLATTTCCPGRGDACSTERNEGQGGLLSACLTGGTSALVVGLDGNLEVGCSIPIPDVTCLCEAVILNERCI